jgi:hypothetical protein
MKLFCRLLFLYLLGLGNVYAQSNEQAMTEAWERVRVLQASRENAYARACPTSGYFHDCVGTLTHPDGLKYLVEFARGDKFVGEFKGGKVHGKGTYTFANGHKYVGEYKDGQRNGQGTFTLANGDEYVGEYKDGKQNGRGTYTHADGRKYVGEYKDGQRNGRGTYTLANGHKYVGEFKDGKIHGQGTSYASNGSIISQGIWADNKLVRTAPVQQATVPNQEIERLRAEAEEATRKQVALANTQRIENERLRAEAAEAKRKQAEAEESIRVAQQLASQARENERLRAEAAEAKRKQAEAEERMRVAQQQAPQTIQTSPVTTQSAIPTGKRVALVVGNKNYKVRPLQNPLNDADDISRSLRTSGFEVIDLRDATIQQMRTAVRQFGDKLLTYDVGLVYYSGHGVEVKGRNYFIPVNADIQREDEIADQGLDVSLILEKMSTAGKGVNILIVDACRDDPFGRSFRSTSRGLAQMDAPRGTIIAYATSPGKVASDGDARERNSPYTKHLLKAMQSPNKPIEQVFKEVRRAVQDETKNQQTPWENTSLSGDFFFRVQR